MQGAVLNFPMLCPKRPEREPSSVVNDCRTVALRKASGSQCALFGLRHAALKHGLDDHPPGLRNSGLLVSQALTRRNTSLINQKLGEVLVTRTSARYKYGDQCTCRWRLDLNLTLVLLH